MLTSSSSILALDVGEKRIGIAIANAVARIAHALTTLDHTDDIMQKLIELIKKEDVAVVVMGLPRSLSGDETPQTQKVRDFGRALERASGFAIQWQDEALTSVKAEEELQKRGKPYQKGDIDALAAVYILEDYLNDHLEVRA
ncbi:MAG TPA: Holliday junction resolvase RuvX [Candidatus Saccharimonadales bacterium]